MPLAGSDRASRAKAHLRWAGRYKGEGNTLKADAHLARALHYTAGEKPERSGFGTAVEIAGAGGSSLVGSLSGIVNKVIPNVGSILQAQGSQASGFNVSGPFNEANGFPQTAKVADCRRFMDGKEDPEVRETYTEPSELMRSGSAAVSLYFNKTVPDSERERVTTELRRAAGIVADIAHLVGRPLSVFVNTTLPRWLGSCSDPTSNTIGAFITPKPDVCVRCEFGAHIVGQIRIATFYKYVARVFVHEMSHAIYWKRVVSDGMFKNEVAELSAYLVQYKEEVERCERTGENVCGKHASEDVDEFLAKLVEYAYVPYELEADGTHGLVLGFLRSDQVRTAAIMRLVYEIIGVRSRGGQADVLRGAIRDAISKVTVRGWGLFSDTPDTLLSALDSSTKRLLEIYQKGADARSTDETKEMYTLEAMCNCVLSNQSRCNVNSGTDDHWHQYSDKGDYMANFPVLGRGIVQNLKLIQMFPDAKLRSDTAPVVVVSMIREELDRQLRS